MLKAEKLEVFPSVEIKKYPSGLRKVPSRPYQKGSILIGLIITMVIMASLGAGMVYLTTTATFQELFGNNHARAYYAAESGARYAMAVIRDAYATDITKLSAINANQNFTMSDGSSFQITNWLPNGANPVTIKFSSTGTVNSGFLQAKRQLNYSIQPANQIAGGGGGTTFTDPLTNLDNFNPTGGFGGWTPGSSGGNDYLQVTGTNPGKGGATMGLASSGTGSSIFTNNVDYDVQVKVKAWDGATHLSDYLAGISFRMDQTSMSSANFFTFHTSFFQMTSISGLPSAITTPPLQLNIPYILFWIDAGGQPQNNSVLVGYKALDFMPSSVFYDNMENGVNGWAVTSSGGTTGPWTRTDFTSTPANYHSSTYSWRMNLTQTNKSSTLMQSGPTGTGINCGSISANSAFLTFWHKLPNFNGHDTANTNVQICTGAGGTSCTTLFTPTTATATWTPVEIVIPVNLTNTTFIKFNAATATGSGSKNIEWYIDDVRILTDWSTILVRIRENNVVSDPFFGTTNVNDIEIFYGSTASNGTGANTTPLDDNRNANPLGQTNWPPDSITSLTAAGDKFTLVSAWTGWNGLVQSPPFQFTASDGCKYKLLGTGNELNAIIRTNCRLPETLEATRSEVGLHAFGNTAAGNIYFDDFSIKTSGGGGADGGGGVIVSP